MSAVDRMIGSSLKEVGSGWIFFAISRTSCAFLLSTFEIWLKNIIQSSNLRKATIFFNFFLISCSYCFLVRCFSFCTFCKIEERSFDLIATQHQDDRLIISQTIDTNHYHKTLTPWYSRPSRIFIKVSWKYLFSVLSLFDALRIISAVIDPSIT